MERPAEQPPNRAGRAQVATLLADPVWDLQPAARTADNPVGRWVTSGCQALTPPQRPPTEPVFTAGLLCARPSRPSGGPG